MKSVKNRENGKKWDRIEQIHNLLLVSSFSVGELAEKFCVSTKTIGRDLEKLKPNGLVKNGRKYKIDKSLSKDDLSENERIIVGILKEISLNQGARFYTKALPLLESLTAKNNHCIYANLNNEILDDESIRVFEIIQKAIEQKSKISFFYDAFKEYKFIVKPLNIAFFDGFWYLICLDSQQNDKFKSFHLKSIKKLIILDEKFKVNKDIEQKLKNSNSIWINPEIKPFEVRLHVEKEAVKFFKRRPLRTQSITGEDKDGSVEITIEVTDDMAVIPLILSYMPYIKVLSPKKLENKIKKIVSSYMEELH